MSSSEQPAKPIAPITVERGNSVTFGYRVPVVWPERPKDYDQDWLPYPMLLEKQLRLANLGRQIEVITMAVPGYTSHQGLAWLRHDIDYLQPDMVIVSFGWNDVSLSDIPDREAIRTDWYPVAVRWLVDHSRAFAHATNWLRRRNKPPQAQPIKPSPRVSDAEYVNNRLMASEILKRFSANRTLGELNVPEFIP